MIWQFWVLMSICKNSSSFLCMLFPCFYFSSLSAILFILAENLQLRIFCVGFFLVFSSYLLHWVLSKEVSSTIFKIFGMTRPGIEHQWSGRPGFNPRSCHTKDFKMVLDTFLLNTQQYKVRIKGKLEQSREGVVASPTPRCSSYRKRSLLVSLDYGR